MGLVARARAFAARHPLQVRVVAGYVVFLATAAGAMGFRLWCFQARAAHRFTAAAILTGTFRLRNALGDMGHDEQVHGGAGYTNWGFGVPLLQTPFHALKRFFPDRAIYFVYLAATIPVLWAALDRLIALRKPAGLGAGRRVALSGVATFLVLSCTVYPLMSYRFLVYEETVSYMLVFELLALSAYVFAVPTWSTRAVALIGVAAGVGLMVRPTGLFCLAAWGLVVALESRALRPTLTFTASAAPFVALWLATNWLRTGAPLGLGLSNSLPYYGYHVVIDRFGDRCADSPAHFLETSARLLRGLFLWTPGEPEGWMKSCHFDFEVRTSDGRLYPGEGFMGLHVLVGIAALVWYRVVRGGQRLAAMAPFAMMALLFVEYVLGCAGFAWRYAADFWPLLAIACVQAFRAMPTSANRWLGPRLTLGVAALGVATYVRHVAPAVGSIDTLDDHGEETLERDFRRARWGTDWPIPSRLDCDAPPDGPYENGAGWEPDCAVDTFTNVYLGVPEKADGRYAIRMEAPGMLADSLQVYVDGRIYTAHRDGSSYRAELDLRREALHSPVVMATVEWTAGNDPPSGRLLSIEIV